MGLPGSPNAKPRTTAITLRFPGYISMFEKPRNGLRGFSHLFSRWFF